MQYLHQKEPLSLIEKYDFIQEKLASGITKEDFCNKVGIDTSEFDSIMLIAGQPTEVRSLVEQNLISPTTLKIAKATADRNEWTQKQFEDFIQESVKLAEQLGKKRVSGSFMQAAISDYKPTEPVVVNDTKETTSPVEEPVNEDKATQPPKPPRLKVKPTAKEIEQLFYEIMFEYCESAVVEKSEVAVYFTKQLADKMEDYWNRVPDKVIEKFRESRGR